MRHFFTLLLLFFLISPSLSQGQIIINTTTYTNPTPAQSLVQNVLLGPGVAASNFTFTGDPSQIGFFKNLNTNLGIDSGIVMTSGDVTLIPGDAFNLTSTAFQSSTGDPDLATILSNSPIPVQGVNDVAILEFDFVPQGDSIKFEYVFASEEYDDFVCDFNDVFGLFISGPGINGPYTSNAENIALVPGTGQEVSITTINNGDSNGSCSWAPQNPQFYIDNSASTQNSFDAFTTVLTARSPVICGQTYHVKMAICDAGDWSYDSGIFLRAKSFFSNAVSVTAATLSGDSTIVEGCALGQFVFNRPGNLADTLVVPITITGTASPGNDYNTLPDSVTFLPGEGQITLDLQALADGLNEGPESVTVSFLQSFCGQLDTVTTTLWIVPRQNLVVTIDTVSPGSCPGQPYTLSLNISGGYPPFSYLWSTGDTVSSIVVNPTGPTNFWVSVSDTCGPQTVGDTVTVNPLTATPLEVLISPSPISCLTGPVTLTATASGGFPNYDFTWFENGFFAGFGPTLFINPPGNTSYSVVVFDACGTSPDTAVVPVTVGPAPITIQALTPSGDSTIVEGCAFGSFVLTLPAPSGSNLDIPLLISGLAANGTDYTLINDTVSVSAGSTTATILIEALSDAQPEINETVTVSIVQDLCGVSDTSSATLYIVPRQPIVMNINSFTPPVCPGDPVNLSLNFSGGYPPFTYNWSTGSTTTSTTLSPPTTTSVWATVSDTCGPQTEADTVVIIVPTASPINPTALPGEIICPNASDTLLASASGGFPPYSFTWLLNGTPVGTGASLIANPAQTTTYQLSVSDACGSTPVVINTGITILPYLPPVVSVVTGNQVTCPNDTLQMEANVINGVEPYSYAWNGIPTGIDSAFALWSATNTFVFASATDACGQTSANDTLFYNIPVLAPVVIDLPADTLVCPGAVLSFTGSASGGAPEYQYIWNLIAGGSEITSNSANGISITANDSSVFRLTGTDRCGTQSFADLIIDVREACEVETVNIFTPNGDGSNQKLVFKNLELLPPSALQIFNRWGSVVYTSEGYKNDWEGGNLSPGTYYYVLTLGGTNEVKNGFFKLIR